MFRNTASGEIVPTAFYLLLGLLLYGFIIHFFLFRPEKLVRWLRLCDRMEPEIGLSITPQTFLSVAIAVTGGLMFARGLPNLFSDFLAFFKSSALLREYPDLPYLVATVVQVFVGFLLLSKSPAVAKYILSRQNPQS